MIKWLVGLLSPKGKRKKQAGANRRVLSRYSINRYLSHHQQVAQDSLQQLLATPLSSLMTWLVIAIALTLPIVLLVLLQNSQQLSQEWNTSVNISVYLKHQVDEESSRKIMRTVQSWKSVSQVRYISPDEGLDDFKRSVGFADVLQYLNENPLPSVLVVSPLTESSDVQSIPKLLERLQAFPDVDQAQLDLQWVDRLFRIIVLGQCIALILGVLLGVAVLLVIGNTIRLAIESCRTEIIVVKLVGATDAFVRRPFLYMGVWYGLGGGLLSWLMVNLIILLLSNPVNNLVAAYNSHFNLSGLGLLGSLLLWSLSAVLGLLGAWLAVGRHLRKINPK